MKVSKIGKIIMLMTLVLLVTMTLAPSVNAAAGKKWSTQGNSVSSSDVFGTTNNQDLRIVTNGQQRMVITADGKVGIGTAAPTTELDVNGVITATGGNSGQWNTAYGWGDHAAAGYMSSYTETDPVFGVSPAAGITGTQIANWDTAYGWGDHSTVGYLTSYTETDPVFGASTAFGIDGTDVSEWNTAYGWGDHATAGYLTSYTETDPVFGAWDKSTGISITESQISDLDHFTNTDETDPTVLASVKDGIDWSELSGIPAGIADGDDNTQLSEGQVDAYVANNGYLTSFTETDPVYGASPAGGITATQVSNWNTAYTDRLKWDGGSTGLNAAIARTNLGLVAGGAGDVWVEKAGDTMTGILNLPTNGLVAGTNQLVLNNGKVGIGTATPTGKFEVTTGNSFGPAALDQFQTALSHYQPSDSDNWQSFTPGVSGQLTRLDLMWRNPSTTATFTLKIYSGQGVGGTLLHTQSITGGNKYAWVACTLSTPVDVTGGSIYTYRVQGSNPYSSGTGMLWKAGGDPYPGGTNDLKTYYGISDYTFKTYVAPAAPDLLVASNGNVGIGTTAPTSALHVVGLPSYGSNTAAISGGLTVGAFYRNGDYVCVVH